MYISLRFFTPLSVREFYERDDPSNTGMWGQIDVYPDGEIHDVIAFHIDCQGSGEVHGQVGP